ncbi:MAG: hypothetical protein JST54_12135 [Deltaproteobacteria bacterium]|nr:hypothetical protein [Deltaproteobacteria bacterium]
MKLRRYRNRALFDVDAQKWVRLKDVQRAVQSGDALTVTQGKKNEDCTALVLIQILYDDALAGRPPKAQPLLDLVKAGGRLKSGSLLERLSDELGRKVSSKG